VEPIIKGFVWAIACAVITLMLHMPDPLVIIISGAGGVAGALD
jgi:hypothetical protein